MVSNKNYSTYCFLFSQGYNLLNIFSFLLRANQSSQSKIAKQLKVERSYINQVITGKRPGLKVKQAISKALGFNPWE